MLNYEYLDSSFVGPHYKMMCDLGYPQLDIKQWDDGEWAILEMLNAPLVPSLTRFTYVLKKIRHTEIREGTVKRLVRSIDPAFPEFWVREAEKSISMEMEKDAAERHTEEMVSEINPDKIALRIAESNPAAARRMGIRVITEKIQPGESTCQ
jgi:hypothetical protein